MVIVERLSIPLDTIRNRTEAHYREFGVKDVRFVHSERRLVNGASMLFREVSGTLDGIKFVYLAQVYSSSRGTIQLVTFTGQNLLAEYRPELERFLDGLTVGE